MSGETIDRFRRPGELTRMWKNSLYQTDPRRERNMVRESPRELHGCADRLRYRALSLFAHHGNALHDFTGTDQSQRPQTHRAPGALHRNGDAGAFGEAGDIRWRERHGVTGTLEPGCR